MKKLADSVSNKTPKKLVAATQTRQAASGITAGNIAGNTGGTAATDATVKQDGNHSEPLQKDAVRKAAAAEQTKLQRDPDALPVAGFPTNREPSSAAKNSEDPVLPSKSRSK